MLIDEILKSGQPLEHYLNPVFDASIFNESIESSVPNFFKQHSIHKTHKIKCFANDPQANIKVFYFQYLKLCFESATPQQRFYITRIQDLILSQDFQFILEEQLTLQQVRDIDLQYKRLILEFFQYLQQQDRTVQQSISLFPIMDKVFVSFFRTLLISIDLVENYSNKIQASAFYEFLISYFGIQTESFDFCIKFKDTDIYVYEEKASQVFIAYNNSKSSSKQQSQELSAENCSVLQGSGPDFFQRIFGKQQLEEVQQKQQKLKSFNQYSLKDFLSQNLEKEQFQKKIMKHERTSSGSIEPPSDVQLDKRVQTQIVDFNIQIHLNNLVDIDDDESIHLNGSKKSIDKKSTLNIQSVNNIVGLFKKQQPLKRTQKLQYNAQKIKMEPTNEVNKRTKYNNHKGGKNIKNGQSILCFKTLNKKNQFAPTEYRPAEKKLNWKKTQKKAQIQVVEMQRLKEKINITEQFTKTFILRQLRQPYQLSVLKMKQRSRASRQNFLKNWMNQA